MTIRKHGHRAGAKWHTSVLHLDINLHQHQDVDMRTTLTLEPDVAERLEQEMRRTGKSMKAVVNESLRLGLGLAGKPPERKPFEVKPHDMGPLRSGIDPNRMNQLLDELEVEEVARKLGLP